MTTFTIVINEPGYLPVAEPMEAETLEDAVSTMRHELEQANTLYRDVESHCKQATEWMGHLGNDNYWAEMPDGSVVDVTRHS